MTQDKPLELALMLIRLSAAAFFLVWSIEKILMPEKQQGVFEAFYFSSSSESVIVALGVAPTAVVLAFAAGLFRFFTYGAAVLMHGASTLSTWGRLIDPYAGGNHLFWAAVPVLAALIALFILRDRDGLLAWGGARR
jgi:putative oxidoreductase